MKNYYKLYKKYKNKFIIQSGSSNSDMLIPPFTSSREEDYKEIMIDWVMELNINLDNLTSKWFDKKAEDDINADEIKEDLYSYNKIVNDFKHIYNNITYLEKKILESIKSIKKKGNETIFKYETFNDYEYYTFLKDFIRNFVIYEDIFYSIFIDTQEIEKWLISEIENTEEIQDNFPLKTKNEIYSKLLQDLYNNYYDNLNKIKKFHSICHKLLREVWAVSLSLPRWYDLEEDEEEDPVSKHKEELNFFFKLDSGFKSKEGFPLTIIQFISKLIKPNKDIFNLFRDIYFKFLKLKKLKCIDKIQSYNDECLTFFNPYWKGELPCVRKKYDTRVGCKKITLEDLNKRMTSTDPSSKCYSIGCEKKKINGINYCKSRQVVKKEFRKSIREASEFNDVGQGLQKDIHAKYKQFCKQNIDPKHNYRNSGCESINNINQNYLNSLKERNENCYKGRNEWRETLLDEEPNPKFHKQDSGHISVIKRYENYTKMCESLKKILDIIKEKIPEFKLGHTLLNYAYGKGGYRNANILYKEVIPIEIVPSAKDTFSFAKELPFIKIKHTNTNEEQLVPLKKIKEFKNLDFDELRKLNYNYVIQKTSSINPNTNIGDLDENEDNTNKPEDEWLKAKENF